MLIYFLPAIIGLGIITSYGDIRFGKIRNRWILLAIAYATIAYLVLFAYNYMEASINPRYILELFTNFIFSVAVGFALWYNGIWTAGDGKLFIAFSSLIPLSSYSVGYYSLVPSVSLLLNIFVVSFFILMIFMVYKIKKKKAIKTIKIVLKEIFAPKKMFDSVISIFAILWVVQRIISFLRFDNGYLLSIVLTFILFFFVKDKLGEKSIYLMILIAVGRLFLDKSIYSLSFLSGFVLVVLVFRILQEFVRGSISIMADETFCEEVSLKELKPGIVLNVTIEARKKLSGKELKELKRQRGVEVIFQNKCYYVKKPKSVFGLGGFIEEEPEGITKEQIAKIKRIGFKSVMVSGTIPFAPFIFLGTLTTMIINGNLLIVVKNLIF